MSDDPADKDTVIVQHRPPASSTPTAAGSGPTATGPTSTRAESGPIIDGYDSFSELGRGGFATVYRARQQALGREVAIKVLHRPADDEATLASFRRESHLVADLSWHPHVAPVLEAGATSGSDGSRRHPYMCFQLAQLGSLEDAVARDGPMNWVAGTRSAIEVADALAAAHASGVIHRDIKIGNVLVDRLGRSQLADFGIASLAAEGPSTDGIAMTVAHAPPELFETGRASPQSDVYSLGSMLYELLVGKAAFARRPDEALPPQIERIVNDALPPMSADVPPELSTVIATAMSKDPARRHSTATDFGRALQHVQSAAGLETTPMPYSDRMAPQLAGGLDRAAMLRRPPLAPPTEVGRAPRRPGGRWTTLAALALGAATGVAGGLLLLDRIGNDDDSTTDAVVAPVVASTVVEVTTPTTVAAPAVTPTTVSAPTTLPAPEVPAEAVVVPGLPVATASASSTSGPVTLADGSELAFSPDDMIDDDRSTSWLANGDGVGITMQFDLGSPTALSSVGLVPGFSGLDPPTQNERFAAVRRIAQVRWTFDDATTLDQSFLDLDDMQRMRVDVTTRTVVLEILASTDPVVYDVIAISQVEFLP